MYSVTTWAVWVEVSIGQGRTGSTPAPVLLTATSVVGAGLYILLNSCYTVAVFTDPGSPLKGPRSKTQGSYSVLPTTEPTVDDRDIPTITVSSTGAARFCKKCHTPKPDRTHHCSTCKRCVLKMDHHCPWLATCLGFHNYKPFVLFLIYTSLFCWICFGSATWWMWKNLFEESQYLEEFAPVNVILLSVIAGIIGLVLTGFTSWHLYLCARGQTTIERLEKTRYLSGVRSRVERNRQGQQHHHATTAEGVAATLQRAGEQILEFHANAVPGASRFEEGEEHASPVPSVRTGEAAPLPRHPPDDTDTPAQRALRRTYASVEEQRERDRYEEYLDDKESEKLPNAFDLGWRRNLSHVFGPKPFLWFLPVCNTTGDGWRWEVSPEWVLASEEAARRKAERIAQQPPSDGVRIRGVGGPGSGLYDHNVHADEDSRYAMSMQTLRGHGHPPARFGRARQRRDFDAAEDGAEVDSFEVSSDEDTDQAWEDRNQSRTWRSWD